VVVDEELASALDGSIADYVTQWLSAAVEAASSTDPTPRSTADGVAGG
jgi:hypothetical protein